MFQSSGGYHTIFKRLPHCFLSWSMPRRNIDVEAGCKHNTDNLRCSSPFLNFLVLFLLTFWFLDPDKRRRYFIFQLNWMAVFFFSVFIFLYYQMHLIFLLKSICPINDVNLRPFTFIKLKKKTTNALITI